MVVLVASCRDSVGIGDDDEMTVLGSVGGVTVTKLLFVKFCIVVVMLMMMIVWQSR